MNEMDQLLAESAGNLESEGETRRSAVEAKEEMAGS